MPETLALDAYVVDVLMRDLAGHDRAPSTYLVYLWLWRQCGGDPNRAVGASLQTIAIGTGLSKTSVQKGLSHLVRRQLIAKARRGATEPPLLSIRTPWRR